jgi:hypothetical protein
MENAMTEIARIRGLSPQDMLMLGIKDVAYIKDIEVDGETAFGLFAANGKPLAVTADRAAAVATAWENGLAPMTLQ